MSLFNNYRKSYITVCFVTAVIYAFVVGVNQPVVIRLADGFVYGVILFASGIVLWNIFRFAIPANYTPGYRIFFISVLTGLTSVLVTGIETLAVYLCFPSAFDVFVSTVPVRVFIAFLLFVLFYLFYLSFHESIEENWQFPAVVSEKIPMDSSQLIDTDIFDAANQTNSSAIQLIDRIAVRSGQKIKIIPIDTILYIKADGDYISIRTAEGSWLKEQTMKYTEDRLPMNDFVRIHRSYIVNIHRISRIERYGDNQLVVLSNNEKIKISAARYRTLKQIIGI